MCDRERTARHCSVSVHCAKLAEYALLKVFKNQLIYLNHSSSLIPNLSSEIPTG